MDEKLTGIYAIRNLVNNRCYIGRSADIQNRWYQHFSSLKNGTGKLKLQNDWNKYGAGAFIFEIIEEPIEDNYELKVKESYYITKYNSIEQGYNQSRTLDYQCLTPSEISIKKYEILALLATRTYQSCILKELLNELHLTKDEFIVTLENISEEDMELYKVFFRLEINYSYYSEYSFLHITTWENHLNYLKSIEEIFLNLW